MEWDWQAVSISLTVIGCLVRIAWSAGRQVTETKNLAKSLHEFRALSDTRHDTHSKKFSAFGKLLSRHERVLLQHDHRLDVVETAVRDKPCSE